jgi:hypothetical protein
MSDITASISALREKVSAQESLLNATIAIAIIDLLAVVAIIAVIFLRKR